MKDLPGRTSTYAEDFSSTRAFRALHAPIEYRGAKTSSSSSSSTLVHLSLGEKNQVKKISTRATNRRTSERLKRNPSTVGFMRFVYLLMQRDSKASIYVTLVRSLAQECALAHGVSKNSIE